MTSDLRERGRPLHRSSVLPEQRRTIQYPRLDQRAHEIICHDASDERDAPDACIHGLYPWRTHIVGRFDLNAGAIRLDWRRSLRRCWIALARGAEPPTRDGGWVSNHEIEKAPHGSPHNHKL